MIFFLNFLTFQHLFYYINEIFLKDKIENNLFKINDEITCSLKIKKKEDHIILYIINNLDEIIDVSFHKIL